MVRLNGARKAFAQLFFLPCSRSPQSLQEKSPNKLAALTSLVGYTANVRLAQMKKASLVAREKAMVTLQGLINTREPVVEEENGRY